MNRTYHKRSPIYPNRVAWLATGDVTNEQLRGLYEGSGGKCHYCGAVVRRPQSFNIRYTRGFDHVKPREAGGANTISNLVVCCCICNTVKGKQYPYNHNAPENQARREALAGFKPYWLGRRGPNAGVRREVQLQRPGQARHIPAVQLIRLLRDVAQIPKHCGGVNTVLAIQAIAEATERLHIIIKPLGVK
jgi:5-methylcytosine-specific restriction endonuclease McrA